MRWCIAMVTLLFAAACSGGLRSSAPAAQTYILRAHAPQAPAAAQPATASLRVALPSAGPGLSTERIVIVQPDHRMSYLQASQWAAELPHVVAALAVERLRTTGDWTAVSDFESTLSSDYFLQITIRRFEAEYTSDGAGRFRLRTRAARRPCAHRKLQRARRGGGEREPGGRHRSSVRGGGEYGPERALRRQHCCGQKLAIPVQSISR